MPERNNDITYEILEHFGTISSRESGWNRELNLISWNGGKPKFDIRDWSEDHERMSKGITLHPWEMRGLVDLYLTRNSEKAVEAGRAREAERRARREAYRQASSERDERLETAEEAPPFEEETEAAPEQLILESGPEQPAPDGEPLMEGETETDGKESDF